jgi:hypothetical protein
MRDVGWTRIWRVWGVETFVSPDKCWQIPNPVFSPPST